ncbi:MAG: manganese-dependent inorganic pyrophosphatase [Eubacteriales bacterium]|nr:manganese-dependent inorganic pyrophosphatase [Eubacteriales bacterium]MDY3332836.1 manganese-dependent inorganic pyrophosphatase [Gallibacter sp.]
MSEKILVYGHKNPDTDSICSAISMAYLKNHIDSDNEYVARAASELNPETEYVLERFGVAKPEVVEDISAESTEENPIKVVLVDHNEQAQCVNGIETAKIIEVVDHHKLGTMATLEPITFTTRPVGCTSTLVYGMFKEFGVVPPKEIAGMMCSAIVSDSMLFKSPTCTPLDEKCAREIAEIAGVDLSDLWNGMLKASLNLDGKTDSDIFYQDYKQFKGASVAFGAGQILAANAEDVKMLKDRMLAYLPTALADEKLDFVCLMITDVSADSTELIYEGKDAEAILEKAFGVKSDNQGLYLEGVVSRKKQLIPPIMAVIG